MSDCDLRKWILLVEQQLVEARAPAAPRGASLYHGTSCLAAAQIIASGFLQASSDGHGIGVSMSDAWASAEEFAFRKDSEDAAYLAHEHEYGDTDNYEEDFAQSMEAFPHLSGVVFALDTKKLTAANRVQSVNYDGDWDMEEEWRVMTKTGITIAPFLKAIFVQPSVIAWWIENQPKRKTMLQKLLDHPLRRDEP